jgi:hypothetical protein
VEIGAAWSAVWAAAGAAKTIAKPLADASQIRRLDSLRIRLPLFAHCQVCTLCSQLSD